jgi:hypothetical protein
MCVTTVDVVSTFALTGFGSLVDAPEVDGSIGLSKAVANSYDVFQYRLPILAVSRVAFGHREEACMTRGKAHLCYCMSISSSS